MDIREVYELMEKFEKSNIHSIKLSLSDCEIKLEKAPVVAIAAPAVIGAAVSVKPADVQIVEPKAEQMPASNPEDIVSSPVVGVFYEGPSPQAAPFVKIGSKVKKGDVLGLIEAMKTFNDILAPKDGVVQAVLVQSEDLVEFGSPLFVIKGE